MFANFLFLAIVSAVFSKLVILVNDRSFNRIKPYPITSYVIRWNATLSWTRVWQLAEAKDYGL